MIRAACGRRLLVKGSRRLPDDAAPVLDWTAAILQGAPRGKRPAVHRDESACGDPVRRAELLKGSVRA